MATGGNINIRVVTVVVEYVGHDLGHWCRPCALPSGVRIWIATRTDGRMALQHRVQCHDCGGTDVVIDDDHLRG